jgi:hypothetical protein
MFVKFKAEGKGMLKYAIICIFLKLILISLFIMVSVPYMVEIIGHIQLFVYDETKLDLFHLSENGGWIILNFVGANIIEIIVVFGIVMPIANSEINNRYF